MPIFLTAVFSLLFGCACGYGVWNARALALGGPLEAPSGVRLRLWLKALEEWRRRPERERALAEQMPALFEALAAALRSGHAFHQALDAAAEDLSSPAADLLRDAALRSSLGETSEAALDQAGRALPATLAGDWRMLCTTVALVRQNGGPLPELLDQLTETVRERRRLQGQIDAQTAQAKLSAWVIGALPPFLLVAMTILDPALTEPLFTTLTGAGILLLAFGLEVAGVWLLRKMAEVRV